MSNQDVPRIVESVGLTAFGVALCSLLGFLAFNGRGCQEAGQKAEVEKHRITVQAKKEIILECVREERVMCAQLKELDP